MNLKKLLILLLMAVCVFSLIACGEEADKYEGYTTVIFELEGGRFQNSEKAAVYHYNFTDGLLHTIGDPEKISGKELSREGYSFDGWYKQKVETGDVVEYSGKWDFATDKVSPAGITLYAKWVRAYSYTYKLGYTDDKGDFVQLGVYSVKSGEKFSDYAGYAKKRTGYTALSFCDAEGNEWNDEFVHPGGEGDKEIAVYVKYIKGTFSLVSTAAELKAAKNKNIYLLADIDLGGEEFSFDVYNKKTFEGNNHTISNFKLKYEEGTGNLKFTFDGVEEEGMRINLFNSLSESTISNVTFKDVVIDINVMFGRVTTIYVAPICVAMEGGTLKNVSFEGTYKITALPSGFENENLIIENGKACHLCDEKSVVGDDVKVVLTQIEE